VQKFSSTGAFIGEWGSYGSGHGQFGPIGGLATDAAGDVYVVDSSHDRIEKFNSSGEFITSWGRAGSGPGEFRFLSTQNPAEPPGGGIAVAGEFVYVADSGNDRIERFNLDGGEAMEWGSKGEGPGQFNYPHGVAANGDEVVVADDDNDRIQKFGPEGTFESQDGEAGSGPEQFSHPYGVALDAAGDVYVADDMNSRVVELNPQLDYVRSWGARGSGQGQMIYPRAIAADAAGESYVADTANDRVEVFDPAGGYLRTIGTPALSPGVLTAPRGVAVDPSGRLFVSDTDNNRVEAYSAGGGAFLFSWSQTGGAESDLVEPAGIAFDPRGAVYVADPGGGRIVRLWGEGTYLSEIGGPSELGGALLNGAGSVAVSASTGDLYVADTEHNRLLIYSSTGTLLAKVGAEGGNGAPGSQSGAFDHPEAVTVAPSGYVYVADSGNDRIVKLAPDGAVSGEFGTLGSASGMLHDPSGVAVDASGRVYVLDAANNRIEVFNENGEYLAKWGQRGSALGDLSQPTAIALGCEGSVYVADTDNNRVERFDPASPAGVGCVAPGAWPPPLNVAPVVQISLARSAGVLARRAVALSVSCQRRCRIHVTAKLTATGSPRRTVTLTATRPLPAKAAGHVRLRLSKTSLRELQPAVGASGAMSVTVHILAVGPTGLRSSLTRTYAVRP
jgi:DNA-binding beta-propeller fold protein YncE